MWRFNGTVQTALGQAVAGAQIYICTQPADTSTVPPSPLATIGSDSGGTPLDNPVTVDGNGNFFFYADAGIYTLVYFDPYDRIPTIVFPDSLVVSPGGGSVTSVALTGDGVLYASSVPGSPITSAGTLVPTPIVVPANRIFAGPASGPSAAPGFRASVPADFPAGVGTVTSVNGAVSAGAVFTASFSGGPITGSGALTLTINLANQPANTVLAGPTSGGSGAVTARALVRADIPLVFVPCSQLTQAFSATPDFPLTDKTYVEMTLTGNVTSSTSSGAPIPGQKVVFDIIQDGSGAHTFVWPVTFLGAGTIDGAANGHNVQEFVWNGVNFKAIAAMLSYV